MHNVVHNVWITLWANYILVILFAQVRGLFVVRREAEADDDPSETQKEVAVVWTAAWKQIEVVQDDDRKPGAQRCPPQYWKPRWAVLFRCRFRGGVTPARRGAVVLRHEGAIYSLTQRFVAVRCAT